jgi:anti-sigma regulatory factor (Ser/Thr protein kinase)
MVSLSNPATTPGRPAVEDHRRTPAAGGRSPLPADRPQRPRHPQLARDHVAYLLLRERRTELADTARLLVSEVVTNVYQHTNVPLLTVDTTFRPDRVRVAVRDGSTRGVGAIRPVLPDTTRDGGRGLMLVELLATRWGVLFHEDPAPNGKTIWFVLTYQDG